MRGEVPLVEHDKILGVCIREADRSHTTARKDGYRHKKLRRYFIIAGRENANHEPSS